MDQTIAKTILSQLGGNKFIVMTGSKNFVNIGNGLSMHLTRNKIKAKYLEIKLNAMDTYDLTFSTTKKVMHPKWGIEVDEVVTVKELENIYYDQLQEIFTDVTGLYTHL